MQIKIKDIQVSDRQRQELENDTYPIHELAASIKRTSGPVQRIVVDKHLNLIAGERRLEALKLLAFANPDDGWETAEVDQRGEITETERYEMELEENLHRKALTPKEYHAALLSFHQLKTANNPAVMKGPEDPANPRWTQKNTAETMGVSRGKITQDLNTAELMSLLPEEKQQEIYTKAGGKLDGVQQELDRLLARGTKVAEAKEETDRVIEEAKSNGTKERQEVQLTDALSGLQAIPSQSVDLIITDPPYGTLEGSAGEKNLAGAIYDDRGFSDNDDETLALLGDVIPEMHRVLRPGCHLYLFCGISYKHKVNFNSVAEICDKAGFFVRTLPLIWCKDKIQGFKPPFTHWPLAYEAILFASTGKRETDHIPSGDFLLHQPIAGTAKKHRFEKPIALIQSLIKVSGVSDGRLLDPFCGSGSTLLAGRKTWMHVQGFDSDPQAFLTARESLEKWDKEVLESNPTQGEEMLKRVKAW